MVETVGHEGCDDPAGSGVQAEGEVAVPVDATAETQARFEHEAAALDLSEAEQLALWATRMAEQGDVAESRRLEDLSARRYDSADGHHQRAERLESELDQHD